MKLETEVCVLGAGPAGATFATRMAQLGHHVLLVERSSFPRAHVGEAMTPAVWDLLDVSGARSALEALDIMHSTGARVRWIDDHEQFVCPSVGKRGFTVDRAEFDRVLLETARSAGAVVVQPAGVASVERSASGWQIALTGLSRGSTVGAQFLADASGRGSRLRGQRVRTSPHTIALDGLWSFDTSQNYETHIEARPEGWYWGAHLPGRRYKAMAFVDSALLRKYHVTKTGLEAFYRKLLSGTRALGALKAPRLAGPVIAHDATCYFDAAPIDSTSIKLGEAAFAIDPLSSSGVQKALQTALTGSIAASTILGSSNSAAAIDFYLDNQRRSVMQHAEWAASHYREHRLYQTELFWLRRTRQPFTSDRRHRRAYLTAYRGQPVRLAPGAEAVRVPCAVGDHVEMRDALHRPGSTRPVAFLNGIDLAPLIRDLASAKATAGSLVLDRVWVSDERHALSVSWLVRQCLLETVPLRSVE